MYSLIPRSTLSAPTGKLEAAPVDSMELVAQLDFS